MKTIRLELYADVVCPWCWIGEARWKRAIAERPDVQVALSWRPFQLNPGAPPEGESWEQFVQTKFGGWDRARQLFAQVAGVGKGEGLDFDFEKVSSHPSTRDAHRLVLLGAQQGKGLEVAERLFRAHFSEGSDLGKRETLGTLGVSVGLDEDAVRTFLNSGQGEDAVAESQAEAARLGIRGVPFAVLDGKFGVSGAQPFEVMLQALDEAARG